MKRFLSLFLLTLLLAGITNQSLAISDCNTIIYEAALGEETNYQQKQYDLTQYAISADIPLDNFKIGLDCSYSLLEDDSVKTYESYAYKLKGGLAITNTDEVRLDLTGGYLNNQYRSKTNHNASKITYKSMIVGLDGRVALSEHVWVNANYVYGVNPRITTASSTDRELDQLWMANVRLNFQFLEDTGLSVGYRWENIKNDVSLSKYNIDNKGYTIGLTYLF
jgi:hypothetical protein